MATVHSLAPRGADRTILMGREGDEEDDGVATLSLIARQFADAAGADGAALFFRDDEEERMLALEGACVGAPAPTVSEMEQSAQEMGRSGPRWLLRRFPISRDGRSYMVLGTFYKKARAGARLVTEAENRFQPLLAGVGRLWARGRASERRLSGYVAALNHHSMGVVLLDGDGDILFANEAANALLETGAGVRRRKQTLIATDLSDAVKLQVAIGHVTTAAGSDGRQRTPVVALKRPMPQRPLLVTVLPPRQVAGGEREVAAILYLCDPDQDIGPLMDAVCRHYRLSPVETRLASALACGATLAEAAELLRIKEQTARSYLKQIFIKTETRRQGELIRVMLTSASRARGHADVDVI